MHPWPGVHHAPISYFTQRDLHKIPAKRGEKKDNLTNCYDPDLTSVAPSARAPPASLWSDQKHKPLLLAIPNLGTSHLKSSNALNQHHHCLVC